MGKIAWIASYPKSGNTWMRLFLYAYFTLEKRDMDAIDINAAEFERMYTQDSMRFWYQDRFDKPWSQVTNKDVASVRMAVQEKIASGRRGLVFVKTHNALLSEYGHPTINSAVTASAIYIVRNPLDLVDSVLNHYGLTSRGKAIAFINNEVQITKRTETHANSVICSWRRNVESWTGMPREGIYAIRYEDLIADPVETFSGVIRFLNQPLDLDRVRKAVELTAFDRLREAERESGFIERPGNSQGFFRKGEAGGWRSSLTKWQVGEIVKANQKQMRRFGYLPAD